MNETRKGMVIGGVLGSMVLIFGLGTAIAADNNDIDVIVKNERVIHVKGENYPDVVTWCTDGVRYAVSKIERRESDDNNGTAGGGVAMVLDPKCPKG